MENSQLFPLNDFERARQVVVFQDPSFSTKNEESEDASAPKGIFKETWEITNPELSFQNKICTEALMLKRKTRHYTMKQVLKREKMRQERRRSKRFTSGVYPKTAGLFETTS